MTFSFLQFPLLVLFLFGGRFFFPFLPSIPFVLSLWLCYPVNLSTGIGIRRLFSFNLLFTSEML